MERMILCVIFIIGSGYRHKKIYHYTLMRPKKENKLNIIKEPKIKKNKIPKPRDIIQPITISQGPIILLFDDV